jgi:hypothetical protein
MGFQALTGVPMDVGRPGKDYLFPGANVPFDGGLSAPFGASSRLSSPRNSFRETMTCERPADRVQDLGVLETEIVRDRPGPSLSILARTRSTSQPRGAAH